MIRPWIIAIIKIITMFVVVDAVMTVIYKAYGDIGIKYTAWVAFAAAIVGLMYGMHSIYRDIRRLRNMRMGYDEDEN